MVELKEEYITIVSGLPRSGTSMMMRMLESGGVPIITDRLRSADDDNPLGYYEFEPVKRMDKDASWLPEAYGKAVKVIYILLYKLPSHYRYKVIFMRRGLDEVIASQKTMLRRRQEDGSSLNDQQLADSFNYQLQGLYSWMNQQKNLTTLYIEYEDVLNAPAQAVSKIQEFLCVPLNTEAMTSSVNSALYRNRSKALA